MAPLHSKKKVSYICLHLPPATQNGMERSLNISSPLFLDNNGHLFYPWHLHSKQQAREENVIASSYNPI
jgi:hypothetical protein